MDRIALDFLREAIQVAGTPSKSEIGKIGIPDWV